MATNKVELRTIEEFMTDYVPVYQPVYPLFLGKSQAYSEEAGKLDFKRIQTVGDIRAKHLTPKDTEMRQIGVNEAKKTFKKYFLANQFTISALQDQRGIEEVVAQVLDEHQKQADDLLLLGEGTSASTMINNGLFWSNDPNYVLENSAAVANNSDNHLADMHAKIVASATKANEVSGRKVLMVYGTTALSKFNGVYTSSPVPFKRVLADVLGPQYQIMEMPSAITPNSANGWLVANLDQVKLHYTALPSLKDQGVNSEKMYAWFNFLMGSMMLEVLAEKGIVRQPVTFA